MGNDVVLSGTGFKTDEQTLDFYSVITDPDFQENAKRSMVVMWAGSVKDIPKGWLLCDGTSGTPDLRDKFILGASEDTPVDSEGGNHTRVLTVDQLPSHGHDMEKAGNHSHSTSKGGSFKHDIRTNLLEITHRTGNPTHRLFTPNNGKNLKFEAGHRIHSDGEHKHKISHTGKNNPIDIKPQFYSLAFIMKD